MILQSLFMFFAFNILTPTNDFLRAVLVAITNVTHNYGFSLIVFALLVKIIFLPLDSLQFRTALASRNLRIKIGPIKQRFSRNEARLTIETENLYRKFGINTVAMYLLILLQIPFIYGVFSAIAKDKSFGSEYWLWIGTDFAKNSSGHYLAGNLSERDIVLVIWLAVCIFLNLQFNTSKSDKDTVIIKKIISYIVPVLIGFIAWNFHWTSAVVLYWVFYSIFIFIQNNYFLKQIQ